MSLAFSGLCEIRIPTFRRPKLLRRALLSLLAQTYTHWRCVVLDDCRDGSARSVVAGIQDKRIEYSQNPKQLGAIGNIDKAFVRGPLFGGTYAFVLEDDNYLLPTHIERSIGLLAEHDAKVALCNQYCEMVDIVGEPGKLDGQTLNWMYEPGTHSPEELLPALLFSHGFSNGAAFWRTDCRTDFQIGAVTNRPEVQESLRLLRLKDPVYVSLESTSVWRARDPQLGFSDRKLTVASFLRYISDGIERRMAEKERIDYQSAALQRLGTHRIHDFVAGNAIRDFATFRRDRAASIEQAMLLCGYNSKLTSRGQADRVRWLLIGFMARHLFPTRLRA